jgi:hypothetical protein
MSGPLKTADTELVLAVICMGVKLGPSHYVFKNRVLRIIFGLKRDKVTGDENTA